METTARHDVRRTGFASRREAGDLLAEAVAASGLARAPRAVVVGLARGGVAVAAQVAAALGAPLEALAVRKIGHPWQPEYGIGAVAPGGVRYVRARDGLSDQEVERAARAAEARADELDRRLHERRARVSVDGATCVLVDDGLATGGTMVAAVRWARANGVGRVVAAVPVGARATVRALEREAGVDRVICLLEADELGAVGAWYADFRQVQDEDVVALLGASAEPGRLSAAAARSAPTSAA